MPIVYLLSKKAQRMEKTVMDGTSRAKGTDIMNINDYKYVTTIAELGSYSAAARELFITQPSLSQRIRYIEAEYGVTLFSRGKSGVCLTPDGKLFVQYAKRILTNESDLRAEFSGRIDPAQPTLRVGLSWVIDSAFFQHFVTSLVSEYPSIRFEFFEEKSLSLQDSVLNGKIDLAICYLPVESSDLSYRILFNDSFVLLPAENSTLKKRIKTYGIPPGSYIPPELLNNEPFSACTPGTRLRNYLYSVMETEQVTPHILHTIRRIPMLYSFAVNGLSSTILYRSYFYSDEITDPYYFIDSMVSNSLPIGLVWRKNAAYAPLFDEIIQKIRSNQLANFHVAFPETGGSLIT